MRIEACRDSAKWDAYVASMPTASNYHRWNWKHVIEDTFNHEAFYLAAFEGDAIQGISNEEPVVWPFPGLDSLL